MDVLAIIRELKERLWYKYGDVLAHERDQNEKNLTYYVSYLLERRGHKWFKSEGVEGACYTEKALQDAFTAGYRIGQSEAKEASKFAVEDKLYEIRSVLGI